MTARKRVAIHEIIGGGTLIDRDIGDVITNDTIYETYRRYPGFKAIVQLGIEVIWSNGLNEDSIEPDRLLELKDGHEYMDLYGFSIIIVDARGTEDPTADAWHPMVDGIGFRYSEFSKYGDPLSIDIMMNRRETETTKPYPVPAYPCELDEMGERILTRPIPGRYGFFSIRTRGGIKGVRGLPKYLDLIDPIRGQYDILKSYIPYAEKQGLAHPVVYLKDNSTTNRAQVKSDFAKQPQKDRLVIIDMEDAIEYQSPQQNAWDPWPILDWVNSMIARDSQMNKLMLSGDPGGMIATSETAIGNWEAKVKESQVYLKTQYLPILIALGGSPEINFSDPSKPSFLSLMEGIKAIREGMDGVVAKEDIIRLMNERLELEGDDMLTVAPDEEQEDMEDDNNGPESSGSDKGSKADKTKTD